jgi:YD repeat-containing protein
VTIDREGLPSNAASAQLDVTSDVLTAWWAYGADHTPAVFLRWHGSPGATSYTLKRYAYDLTNTATVEAEFTVKGVGFVDHHDLLQSEDESDGVQNVSRAYTVRAEYPWGPGVESEPSSPSIFGGKPTPISIHLDVANVSTGSPDSAILDQTDLLQFDDRTNFQDSLILGTFIVVNDAIDPASGAPGFARGYVGAPGGASSSTSFVPLLIDLSPDVDVSNARLAFQYFGPDAAKTKVMGTGAELAYQAVNSDDSSATGYLRLWKRDGTEQRDPAPANGDGDGDFIQPSSLQFSPAAVDTSKLDWVDIGNGFHRTTVYVEAFRVPWYDEENQWHHVRVYIDSAPVQPSYESATAAITPIQDKPFNYATSNSLIAPTPGVAVNTSAENGYIGLSRIALAAVNYSVTDISSSGYGSTWSQSRTWTNSREVAGNPTLGGGWTNSSFPHLIQGTSTIVAVLGGEELFFDRGPSSANSTYTARFGTLERMTYDSGADLYTLTDTTGARIVFNGFSVKNPQDLSRGMYQRGAFKAYVSAGGSGAVATAYTDLGNVARVKHGLITGTTPSSFTVTDGEDFAYTYGSESYASETLQSVILSRQHAYVTGVFYGYGMPPGTVDAWELAPLRYASIKNADNIIVSQEGYLPQDDIASHHLVWEDIGIGITPAELIARQRKVPMDAAIQGLDAFRVWAWGGIFQSGFQYSESDWLEKDEGRARGTGINAWKYKRELDQSGKPHETLYYNYAGQLLKAEATVNGRTWTTSYEYDSYGRVVKVVAPSQLETITSYYAQDDANGPAGYVKTVALRSADHSKTAIQAYYRYDSHTAADVTVHPLHFTTLYRNETSNVNDASGLTTEMTYEWAGLRMTKQTATPPSIPNSQNGTAASEPVVTTYDSYGRMSTVSVGGSTTTYTYDLPTGGITSVHTVGDGEVDVTTSSTYDEWGRPLSKTDANGVASYIRYRDAGAIGPSCRKRARRQLAPKLPHQARQSIAPSFIRNLITSGTSPPATHTMVTGSTSTPSLGQCRPSQARRFCGG